MDVAVFKKTFVVTTCCALCLLFLLQTGKAQAKVNTPSGDRQLYVRLHLGQCIQSAARIEEELQSSREILTAAPDNYGELLKSAYLHFRLGWLYTDGAAKKNHYLRFFDLATRAEQLKPEDYYARLLTAVAKAKIAAYLSQGDQVRIAGELARDIGDLLNDNGEDTDVLYLLSWLNFKVGRVSRLEKILAAILFGGLPEGLSVDNAFSLLQKAIRNRPDYIVYRYDLGLYYLKTGDIKKGCQQFEKTISMPVKSVEGAIYQKWAKAKLKKYGA